MKIKSAFIICLILLYAASIFAQNGGKAEPNRIRFARGKSSSVVTGKVRGDEQAEYTFAANEGQTVKLKITSIPKGFFSSFKVMNAYGEPEYLSDLDAYSDYEFTAPYSGDYLIWVNFRPAGKVLSAKYNLTLIIK